MQPKGASTILDYSMPGESNRPTATPPIRDWDVKEHCEYVASGKLPWCAQAFRIKIHRRCYQQAASIIVCKKQLINDPGTWHDRVQAQSSFSLVPPESGFRITSKKCTLN